MKNDVLDWADGRPVAKILSKETLNHRGLIEMVTGLDVYENTPQAYKRSYRALGIDIINRVPLTNAPEPTPEGEMRADDTLPVNYSALGVYDTFMRHTYLCPTPEAVWQLDMERLTYEDVLVPVPHPCRADDAGIRAQAIGETGLYYPMLYTTLFMWAVEVLGWETFSLAAALDTDRFHDHFMVPCIAKSRAIVEKMARASDSPFVFVHDDLASATGPVFHPRWYDTCIFPHYPEIWKEVKRLGKKIIYVADGNMTLFLPKLVDAGVDGLMFESPATPTEAVIEHFGQSGRFFIGGISTSTLTLGSPQDVRKMVLDLYERAASYPGFCMASGGGLHGNVPLENLEAYFDARAEIGANPKDWRTCCSVANDDQARS